MNTTTTKPSLKGLIESTNIPESLVRAVVRQMGGWESFKESAPDICRGGIDGAVDSPKAITIFKEILQKGKDRTLAHVSLPLTKRATDEIASSSVLPPTESF